MSAMTGAAPVPVPPPMPAVMNSMSAPVDQLGDAVAVLHRRVAADLRLRARAESARQRASRAAAACAPSSACSACASVLAQMNSTPDEPSLDHVLDRVAAAAADADDLDDGSFLRGLVDDLKHGVLLSAVTLNAISPIRVACIFRSSRYVSPNRHSNQAAPGAASIRTVRRHRHVVRLCPLEIRLEPLLHPFGGAAEVPVDLRARSRLPRRYWSRPSSSSPTAVA